jgi:hypothetical protein
MIKTAASVGATVRTKLKTRRRAALLPTMRGNPQRPRSFPISSEAGWLTAGSSIAQFTLAAIALTPSSL